MAILLEHLRSSARTRVNVITAASQGKVNAMWAAMLSEWAPIIHAGASCDAQFAIQAGSASVDARQSWGARAPLIASNHIGTSKMCACCHAKQSGSDNRFDYQRA